MKERWVHLQWVLVTGTWYKILVSEGRCGRTTLHPRGLPAWITRQLAWTGPETGCDAVGQRRPACSRHQHRSQERLGRRRWAIETLFAATKTRGFNFEDTHMIHPDRIGKLFAVLAVAFVRGAKVRAYGIPGGRYF